MATTPKNEEKLAEFEEALRELGESLSPADISSSIHTLRSSKLEDAARAAIYLERLHQNDRNADWDGLLPVDAYLETLREEI